METVFKDAFSWCTDLTWIKSFPRLLALIFALKIIVTPASAQTYSVRHYTINDGLPSNSVRAIFKDSRGIMWIGTDAGLCRFDGSSFKVYNSKDGMASDRAWNIIEDDHHDLWIACFGGGISKFDGEKFTRWTEKDGLVNKQVRNIRYSPKFNIFLIGTNNGLSVFDGKKFLNYKNNLNRTNNRYYTFEPMDYLESQTYIEVFCFFGEVFRYFPATREFKLLPFNYRYCPLNPQEMGPSRVFVTSKKDTLIGVGRKGYNLFKNGKTAVLYPDIGQVFDFTEDKYQNLLIATWNDLSGIDDNRNGGLFLFKDRKVICLNDYIQSRTTAGWTLFFEKETNQVWYGTDGDGLYVIRDDQIMSWEKSITKKTEFHGVDIEASENNVSILTPDDVYIEDTTGRWIELKADSLYARLHRQWISAYLDRSRIDFRKKGIGKIFDETVTYLNGKGKLRKELEKVQAVISLIKICRSDKLIFYDLSTDPHGNLWILANIGLIRYPKIKLCSSFGPVGDYEFSPEGALYFIEYNEIGRIYGIPNNTLIYKFVYGLKDIAYTDIGKLIRGKSSLFYLSEQLGFGFVRNDSTISLIKNPDFNHVYSGLALDSRNRLILGTRDGSILIATFNGDSLHLVKEIKKADGIMGNAITWLCCDSKNYLYAGTNKGMLVGSLADLEAGKSNFRLFDKEEGLESYAGFKAVVDFQDNIWLLTPDRLFKLNTKAFREKSGNKPVLKLRNIEVNYLPFNWKAISPADPWFNIPLPGFSLPYDQRNLSFYFASLNYLNPLKDRFRFKLDGYQKDWSEFTADQKAVFSNIPPGNYTLRVQLMNLNNPDEVAELAYPFTIRRPWFLSWWFYAGIIILIGMSIYIILNRRIRKIKNAEMLKTQIARQMAELEMKALQSQMNPHFTFNALNAIQCFILVQDTDNALAYLDDFAVLIRKTLENISQKHVLLADEIDYLQRYVSLEHMRFDGRFNQSFTLSPSLNPSEILIPPMILQPFVENAILHGLNHLEKGGKLEVFFDVKDGNLYCRIEDNGVGRKKSAEINKERLKRHQSKGTAITIERVQLMNEAGRDIYKVITTDLYDNMGNPRGTRVEITLPLEKQSNGTF